MSDTPILGTFDDGHPDTSGYYEILEIVENEQLSDDREGNLYGQAVVHWRYRASFANEDYERYMAEERANAVEDGS
jgi:hypothetical protein